MRHPKLTVQRFLLAITLPCCLTSCGSSGTTTSQQSALTTAQQATPPAVDTAQEDKDRLALYQEMLTTLKTTKNPPVDEDFNLVTSADIQAFQDRNAGSPTAYTSSSSDSTTSYTPSYSSSSNYSSSSSYSSSGSAANGTLTHQQQYHFDNAIKEAAEADAALARGDLAAAREHKKWADANVQNYHDLGGH